MVLGKRRRHARGARPSKRLKSIVQGMINKNKETKFRQEQSISVNVGDVSAAATNHRTINAIATGDDENTRQGNAIYIRSFWMRGTLQLADTSNVLRIILYTPKNPDDSLSNALDWNQHPDQDKFIVWRDKTITVDTYNPQKQFVITKSWTRARGKNIPGMKATYSNTAGTDIESNSLKLYMVSDSGTVSHPQVDFRYYMYFKD